MHSTCPVRNRASRQLRRSGASAPGCRNADQWPRSRSPFVRGLIRCLMCLSLGMRNQRCMMRKLVLSTLLSASLLATAGCAEGIGTKQGVGTLGGAAAGGLAGAQFGKGTGQLAATAGGVLLGALLGSEVGKSLDRADQSYATRAASRSDGRTRRAVTTERSRRPVKAARPTASTAANSTRPSMSAAGPSRPRAAPASSRMAPGRSSSNPEYPTARREA
jgi:hypothetical protein